MPSHQPTTATEPAEMEKKTYHLQLHTRYLPTYLIFFRRDACRPTHATLLTYLAEREMP